MEFTSRPETIERLKNRWSKTDMARKRGELSLDRANLEETVREISLELSIQLDLLNDCAERGGDDTGQIRKRRERIADNLNYLTALCEYLLTTSTAG